MKAIRLVFVTLLPWVLLVALVVHTVYSTGSTDHTFDNRTKLSRAASGASFLKHVELLCDTGTLKVIRTETWLRPTGTFPQLLDIELYNKYSLLVFVDYFGPGDARFLIWQDADRVTPVVECGTTNDGSPGYVIVHPQTGPDVGRFMYVDYELDGKFERRRSDP
jgi:hypothetical protein